MAKETDDVASDEDEKAESSADDSTSNGKKEPVKAASEDSVPEKKKADKPADKAEKASEKADKPAAEKKKASEPKKAAEKKATPKVVETKAAHDAGGHDDHAAHGHHAINYKEIWVIFAVLFVLTVLEVAVSQIPGINHTLMALALISLAVTKAACVGLYYMHLKGEAKVMRLTVALPFSAPVIYALVLISEGAWRLNRW